MIGNQISSLTRNKGSYVFTICIKPRKVEFKNIFYRIKYCYKNIFFTLTFK